MSEIQDDFVFVFWCLGLIGEGHVMKCVDSNRSFFSDFSEVIEFF